MKDTSTHSRFSEAEDSIDAILRTLYHSYNGADGEYLPVVEAKAQLQKLLIRERLDELLRHSYGKGQVSSYSINRRIATLTKQLEDKEKEDEQG